jgi:hypothetical protein
MGGADAVDDVSADRLRHDFLLVLHLRDGAPNDASVSPQAAIHYQPHLDEVDQGLGDLGVDVSPDA